jgi:hypothetical protein
MRPTLPLLVRGIALAPPSTKEADMSQMNDERRTSMSSDALSIILEPDSISIDSEGRVDLSRAVVALATLTAVPDRTTDFSSSATDGPAPKNYGNCGGCNNYKCGVPKVLPA